MHKQVISFAQVTKFLENMISRGGGSPKPPLAYALGPKLVTGLSLLQVGSIFASLIWMRSPNRFVEIRNWSERFVRCYELSWAMIKMTWTIELSSDCQWTHAQSAWRLYTRSFNTSARFVVWRHRRPDSGCGKERKRCASHSLYEVSTKSLKRVVNIAPNCKHWIKK